MIERISQHFKNKPIVIRKCKGCGEDYKTNIASCRFCSKECGETYNRTHRLENKHCQICGSQITDINSSCVLKELGDIKACQRCQYSYGEIWLLDMEGEEWVSEQRLTIPQFIKKHKQFFKDLEVD